MGNKTATLRWRSGLMASVAILCGLAAGFFVHAGLSPQDMAAPHHHVRGEGLVEVLALLDFDGIGWGFLAVALYLLAYAGLSIWRIVDPVALVASARGVSLHPSVSRRAIEWQEIAEISVAPQKRGAWSAPAPILSITFTSPRRLRFALSERACYRFPGIDIGDGIAERFIACLPIVRSVAADASKATVEGPAP